MNSRSATATPAAVQSPRRQSRASPSGASQHDAGMPDASPSASPGAACSCPIPAQVDSAAADTVAPMAVGLTRPTRSSSARAQSKRSASSNRGMSHGSRRATSAGTWQSSAASTGQSASSQITQAGGRDGKGPQWSFSTSTQSRPSAAARPAARSVQPRSKQQAAEMATAAEMADASTSMDVEVSVPDSEALSHPRLGQQTTDLEPATPASLPSLTCQPDTAIVDGERATVIICPTVRGKGDMPEPLGSGDMFASDGTMEAAEAPMHVDKQGQRALSPASARTAPAESAESPAAALQSAAAGHGRWSTTSSELASSRVTESDPIKSVAEQLPASAAICNPEEPPMQIQERPMLLSASDAGPSPQQPARSADPDAPELSSDVDAQSPDIPGPATAAEEAAGAPTPAPMLYSNAAFLASPRGQAGVGPQRLRTPLDAPLMVASPQRGPSGWSLEANQTSSRGSLDDAHSAFINPAFLDARGGEEGPGTPDAQALMHSPPSTVSMAQLLAPLDDGSSAVPHSHRGAAEGPAEELAQQFVQVKKQTTPPPPPPPRGFPQPSIDMQNAAH